MQTIIKPSVFIGSVLAAILATAFLLFAFVVHANPSYFIASDGTASATSTPVFMTPGTATTTEVFDAGKSLTSAADSAVLTLQLTGSSTLSVAQVVFEYAQGYGLDCKAQPTSCDWYSLPYPSTATTTQSIIPQTNVTTYSLAFASTTVGGAAGTSTRTTRIITIPTPTRYVRAVLTMPIGSLNGAVWMQFIAKKSN